MRKIIPRFRSEGSMANNNEEPSNAPQKDRWYNIRLGSSFGDRSATKFCMLRYEFKPASIDKKQAGSLYKNKDNRVTAEFQNNQPGKQKVTFEGNSEDYKENDGVLFFDGETFRLEHLHRAAKRLRHVRLLGESVAAANQTSTSSTGATTDICSSPLAKVARTQALSKPMAHPMPVEVERIDIGVPQSPDPKPINKNTGLQSATLDPFQVYSDPKSYEPEENLTILRDDDGEMPNENDVQHMPIQDYDINIYKQNDGDDEIADLDLSDDADEGQNAASALQAQVNAEEGQQEQETSSSSGSSESGSSDSGSSDGTESSSSDTDGSNNDSASSGGD